MRYEKIPNELKALDQWVCTFDDSKIPMSAFRMVAASSTDPKTWAFYEQAEWAVNAGHYDHLGFVFHNTGLVGIDIDCGFDDGLMTQECADIVKRCRSYTEKSKSGRGVHILIRGDIPFCGKNNLKGIEIYKDRRFFVMTGNVLCFDEIIENQSAIDYVVSKYFADAPRTGSKSVVEKIYKPIWDKPRKGYMPLRPHYPEIGKGGRNLSLTSLAGSLHNIGFSKKQIYNELRVANQSACVPALSDRELQTITSSVSRYRR